MRKALRLAVLTIAATLAACSATNHTVVLRELRAQLANQFHDCVPLGWTPVPVLGTYYYPGFSTNYTDRSWLAPMWLGSIRKSQLRDPQARVSYEVLEALVRKGLVVQVAVPGGYHYHLTPSAIPYFLGSNEFGDDRDSFSYLCYSRIIPQYVVRTGPIVRSGKQLRFRAAFTWRVSAPAPWSRDPVLQAHSVVLPPISPRVVATFVEDGAKWYVTDLGTRTALPRLAGGR